MAQKLGGDPFEDTPKFRRNQAFLFLKPHANNLSVRALTKNALKTVGIDVLDEGDIDAVTILSRKLIDTHYYAIANKASLSKPAELHPPAPKLDDFSNKFGLTWQAALADSRVYNAVDACDVLGVDSEALDAMWASAKAAGDLLKFGGGFYVGKLPKKSLGDTAVVPSASSLLAEMPRSLYGGLDALALSNGFADDSEKMLLFPESVIKVGGLSSRVRTGRAPRGQRPQRELPRREPPKERAPEERAPEERAPKESPQGEPFIPPPK